MRPNYGTLWGFDKTALQLQREQIKKYQDQLKFWVKNRQIVVIQCGCWITIRGYIQMDDLGLYKIRIIGMNQEWVMVQIRPEKMWDVDTGSDGTPIIHIEP